MTPLILAPWVIIQAPLLMLARCVNVVVSANVSDNTIGLSLTSPSGKRYGSSIALPVLGQNIAVTALQKPANGC